VADAKLSKKERNGSLTMMYHIE